jgi:hypothetical protein
MPKLLPLILLFCAWAAPAHAANEDPDGRDNSQGWSLSAASGATIIDGDGDQPFLRLGLTRFLGDGYLHGAVTHFAVRDAYGLVDVVPASTWQASLGGGYNFGAISIDGYGAIGWRKFRQEAFRRRAGTSITVDSQGKMLSGGLSLTYQLELDARSALSPFVAGDLSRIDTARAIVIEGRGTIAQKESQTGRTGSFGLTVDRLVGSNSEHRVEAYGAVVATSNSAVAIRSSAPIAAARLFGPQDFPGFKQTWAEYGASATLHVSDPVLFDVSAVRTAGFRGGESTNLFAGLRYRF